MRTSLSCLVLAIFCIAKAVSTDDCLDPKNVEDNVFLWEGLFTKINAILSDTTKLSENFLELDKNLKDLTKRQDEQDVKLANFMESTQKQLEDVKFGQFPLHHEVNMIMGDTRHQFHQLQKWEKEQEQKTTAYMESTQKHLSEMEKRQHEHKQMLHSLMDQYLSNNIEWTTIMRRQDGSVDFYRNWTDYQAGFGHADGEFFIGLDKLHNLTTLGAPQELLIIFKDFQNEKRTAKYDLFQIGNETEKYALVELGTYSGDAGDSLTSHKGMKFTTFDEDNDTLEKNSCAKYWKGAWWFKACYDSLLFGTYRPETERKERGIGWHAWKEPLPVVPLKFVEMKIRPKIL